MATNNPPNGPMGQRGGSGHPDDMLEAFALDALDLDEEERVQDHLDGCDLCSEAVDHYQATAASLAQSVNTQEPPPGLRARLMQAVSREEPEALPDPEPLLVAPLGDRLVENRLIRVLIPVAASVAMVLVVLAVALNVRTSSQVGDLKRENASLQARLATTTVQMNDAANVDSEVMDSVLKLQQASFELAQPDNMSLELRSPSSESRSQGILLVSSDGNRGVIMVAGMEPPNPSTSYDIWLMRGHDKVRAGRVEVDSRGWGTVSLLLPEPIMGFEKVELTLNAVLKASQTQSDMVLEGNLVSMNTPRFVTYAPWR